MASLATRCGWRSATLHATAAPQSWPARKNFCAAELIGDGENVGGEFGERVVSGAAGLAAGVVAALVGDDDAEAGGGERLDLSVPGIPEFGEAMEQDDDGAVWRTGGDGVEID